MTNLLVLPILGGRGEWTTADDYGTITTLAPRHPRIPVVDQHNGPQVGEVIYLERHGHTVTAVAATDVDQLEPWHSAASMLATLHRHVRSRVGDHLDTLRHIALVASGAAAAGPVYLAVDVNLRATTSPPRYWDLSDRANQLIRNAVAWHRTHERGRTLEIVDTTPADPHDRAVYDVIDGQLVYVGSSNRGSPTSSRHPSHRRHIRSSPGSPDRRAI